MKVDGVVIGGGCSWSDLALVAEILFVIFPWIILLINCLLWFFGCGPMLELTAAKTVFAVLWPVVWGSFIVGMS